MDSPHRKAISRLVVLIALVSGIAAAAGIFSGDGPGPREHLSVRGETVILHGRGIYRHMTADVALQGIAQDWVTLLLGIPALLAAAGLFHRGSARGGVVLCGTLFYFLVTYLFYTAMGAYNEMFLAYVLLLGISFFALGLALSSFAATPGREALPPRRLTRKAGLFLVFNSSLVALLWLGVIVPPLLDGSLYPSGLAHYTTMIVQGFDLGLLLPIAAVSGILAARGDRNGSFLTCVYVVFLVFMMAALISKLIFMARAGIEVFPAVIVMPFIFAVSLAFAFLLVGSMPPTVR